MNADQALAIELQAWERVYQLLVVHIEPNTQVMKDAMETIIQWGERLAILRKLQDHEDPLFEGQQATNQKQGELK